MPNNREELQNGEDAAERPLGVTTATLLVVASMIGVGIFTSTGFLVAGVPSLPAILLAWVIGGVASLFGALAYAELAVLMPRNGGEYQIISRLFHPALGFISAWVSLVVGFCAPIAVSSLAFSEYLEKVFPQTFSKAYSYWNPEWVRPFVAAMLVLTLTTIHVFHVSRGSRFQNVFTICKILLVVIFIAVGLSRGDLSRISNDPRPLWQAVKTPAFAIGLMYIYYSYTGWNAAVYVAGEIRNPRRNLPIALFLGTTIVTLLYLGLNVVFLAAAPREELAGVEAVAHAAAVGLFGESAARFVSFVILLGLVSMVGAIIMTGSRVYETVGQDFPKLRWLAKRKSQGGPIVALGIQAAVAMVMIAVGNIQVLMEYVGVTLALFSGLTVSGLFVVRKRFAESPKTFRMPGYPITPLIFLLLMAWVVGVAVYLKPLVALTGLLTLASGWLLYLPLAGGAEGADQSAPP